MNVSQKENIKFRGSRRGGAFWHTACIRVAHVVRIPKFSSPSLPPVTDNNNNNNKSIRSSIIDQSKINSKVSKTLLPLFSPPFFPLLSSPDLFLTSRYRNRVHNTARNGRYHLPPFNRLHRVYIAQHSFPPPLVRFYGSRSGPCSPVFIRE